MAQTETFDLRLPAKSPQTTRSKGLLIQSAIRRIFGVNLFLANKKWNFFGDIFEENFINCQNFSHKCKKSKMKQSENKMKLRFDS